METSLSVDEDQDEFHYWVKPAKPGLRRSELSSSSNESILEKLDGQLEALREFRRSCQSKCLPIRKRGGLNATCSTPKKYNIKFSGSATVLSRPENIDQSPFQRSKSIDSMEKPPGEAQPRSRWLQVPGCNTNAGARKLSYNNPGDRQQVVPQNIKLGRASTVTRRSPRERPVRRTPGRSPVNTTCPPEASPVCRTPGASPLRQTSPGGSCSRQTTPKQNQRQKWGGQVKNNLDDVQLKLELGHGRSWNASLRSDYDSDYELNKTHLDQSGYADDLSTPFNPHPVLVSTPNRRFGKKPLVYNRKDASFENDIQYPVSTFSFSEMESQGGYDSFKDRVPIGKSSLVGGPAPRLPFNSEFLDTECEMPGPPGYESIVNDSSYDPQASYSDTFVQPPMECLLNQRIM